MAAAAQAQLREAPGPVFVESVFFKTFPDVQLESPVEGLLEKSVQALECSNKFGALVIAGQTSLLILRAEDVLSAQTKAADSHRKHVDLAEIPHISVNNESFSSPPNLVSISNGEEFIAVDTSRNGVPFVLIFKLEQFLLQGGTSSAFCEIRASSRESSKVSGIAWNPGENMNNMLAINCDDGSLQLATIKGEKAAEICSFKEGGVKSMCWSPKGKQLVVGKINGNLSQLKLDLTEAKQIPGLGDGRVPSAIFWSSTTQFLVNFVVQDMDVDFMQLDLAKGAPPLYSTYGDIFVSDKVSSASKCIFTPLIPWNMMLCSSNTINDVLVLMKGLETASETWSLAEIDDNRRAAIPIDSFAVGASVFTGCETRVYFSETEDFEPMPILFVLSDAGALCSVAVVNRNSSAPSLFQKVTNPLKGELFQLKRANSGDPPVSSTAPYRIENLSPVSPVQPLSQSVPSFKPPPPIQQPLHPVQPQNSAQSSIFSQPSLPSGLPSLQQVEDLKRIVEERRALGAHKLESDDGDYSSLAIELEKFQKRMENFRRKQLGMRQQVTAKLEEICKEFEQEVLVGVNIMEEFVNAVEETTNAQKDEVVDLKEKILSRFTQLEYCKALAERNKDPRYIQLLRAQQMDPASLHRFQAVDKLYHYVRNQVNECERFYKIQNQNSKPLEGAAAIQVIYQALSNHSKIIKRLVQNVNNMRAQLGLGKCVGLDEDMEVFQTPSLGYGYFEKKPMVKSRPSHSNPNNYRFISAIEKKPAYSDRITLDDITAGVSRVKLQREGERYPERKPLKITAKKLEIVAKACSNTIDIEVSTEFGQYDDPLKPNARREDIRKKISQLDDKTMPPMMMNNNKSVKDKVQKQKENEIKEPVNNTIGSTGLLASGFRSSLPATLPSSSQVMMSQSKPTQSVSPAASVPKTQAQSQPVQSFGFTSLGDKTGGSLFGLGTSSAGIKPEVTDTCSRQSTLTPTPSANNSMLSSLLSNSSQGVGSTSMFKPQTSVAQKTAGSSASPSPTTVFKPNTGEIPKPEITASSISDKSVPASNASNASSAGASFSFSGSTFSMSASGTSGAGLFGAVPSMSGSLFGSIPSSSSAIGNGSSETSLFGSKPITFGTTSTQKPTTTEIKTDEISSNSKTQDAPISSVAQPAQSQPILFAAVSTPLTATTQASLFGAPPVALSQTSLFSSPPATSQTSLFGVNPASQPGIFGSAPAFSTTAQPNSLFGTPPSAATTTQSPSIAFGSSTEAKPGGFGSSTEAKPGIFGSSTEAKPAMFGSSTEAKPVAFESSTEAKPAAFVSTTEAKPVVFGSTTEAKPAVFGSSTEAKPAVFGSTTEAKPTVFGSTTEAKPAVFGSTTEAKPVVFGSSTEAKPSIFGSSTETKTSIFGGAGDASQLNTALSSFGSANSPFGGTQQQQQPSAGVFGSSSVTSIPGGGIFSSPPNVTAPAFGAAPSSVFGSSTFGATAKPATTGGSVFGNSSFSGGAPATSPENIFGGNAFGGLGAQPSGDAAEKNVFGGGTFGANSNQSIFGGGSTGSGIFGGGTAGTTTGAVSAAQSAFSFSSPTKPAGGFGSAPVFGAGAAAKPGFGSPPVFGGTPAFGSTSPFGSAFGSSSPSTTSSFGGGSSSIFGGGNAQQSAPTFGALAQTAPPQQTSFGAFGSTGQAQPSSPFGGQPQSPAFGQPQQQQTSPFGGQKPASASFGGSAFSSWR